jgi:AcrR family transcriptional regulator
MTAPMSSLSPTDDLEPRRPGRPRDARADRAILEATFELAAELGLLGLSMDAVALRAGVSKATIYRRWSSKEALLLDAWRELAAIKPMPDTGVLRDDLRVLYTNLCAHANDTPMGDVLPQMIAASRVNPELRAAFQEFITERRKPTLALLARAVERGELPAGIDVDALSDLLGGAFFYRLLVSGGPIDDQLVEFVLDTVLAGVENRRQT